MKLPFGIAAVAAGMALAASGCAHEHLTTDQLVLTQSSITSAEQAGAGNNPQASLRLKYAGDEMASAKEADKNGDIEEARRLVNRAQVDAELALALTRESEAQALANHAMGESKAVQ